MSEKSDTDKREPMIQLPLKEYKGSYMFEAAEIEDYASFKCRDDDVWVCTFPRSGTTLTQQIVYLIMTLDFEKGATVDLDDRFPYADFYNKDLPYSRGLKYLDNLPTDTPRFIKSHIHRYLLPEELKNGKGKIVYVARNPKATVISLYRLMLYLCNPQAPSLREFIELFLTDKDVLSCPWGLHLREFWEHRNDSNVLFIQFEKLVQNRRSTIERIAKFLDRDLSDDMLDKVTEHTRLESMKNNPSVNFSFYESKYQTDAREGSFINKGEVSGWKKDIPKDLEEKLDKMIARELGDTDIEFE